MLQWVSNACDPSSPVARARFDSYYASFAHSKTPATPEERWQKHIEWQGQFIPGPPQPTPYHTADELSNMGMIGLYREVDDCDTPFIVDAVIEEEL